jgi:hypothetical protein
VRGHETLEVRCGRCGRPHLLPLSELLGLRTFDCEQCRRLLQSGEETAISERSRGDDEIALKCAEALRALSAKELRIVLRRAVQFTPQEIRETYGTTLGDLANLLRRLVARLT